VLAEPVWDSRCRVSSKKQGKEGHSANHIGDRSDVKAWDWGRVVEFDNASVLHWPMDGQDQLLKGAEEDQIEQEVIWAEFV
jgi:hypothetical protein